MKGKKQFKYEQAAVEALKTLLARADFGRLSDATVDQLLDESFKVPLTVSLWNAVLAAVVFYAPAEKLPQLLSYLQYSMVRQLGGIKAVPKLFFGHFIPQLWELTTYCRDIQRSDWYRHQTQSNDDANNNDEVGDAQSSPPPPQPEPYKVCKLIKRVKFPISFMPVDPQDPDQKRVTPAMESFECAILGLLAMLIDMVSGQEEAETLFLCKVATKKSAKKDAKKNTEKVTKKVTKEATKEVIKKATKKGKKKNTKEDTEKGPTKTGFQLLQELMADVLAELAPLLETLENGNILENSDEGLTAKQLVTIESAKMGLKALMRARNELSENLFDEHLKINPWDKVDSQISSVATAFKAAVAQSGFTHPNRQLSACQKAVLSLKTALLNFTEWSPTRDTAGERPLLSRHTATNRQMFASYPKSKIPHGSYFSVSGNFDMSYHAYLLKNGPTTPEATLANSTAAAAASSQTLHCIEQWPNLYVHGWPSSYLLQTATLKLVLCSQTEQGVIEVPTNLSQLEGTEEEFERTFPNGRSEMVVTLLLDRSVAPAVKNTFSMCRFLVNGVEVIPIEGSPEYAQAMAELAKRAELKTPFDACPVLAPSNFNDLLVYFERKEWKYAIKGAADLCARGLVLTPFVSFTEEEGGQAPVEADEAAHHVGDHFRDDDHPDRPENDDHRNEDEIMDAENGDAYLERSPPPNNEAEGHPDRPENDDHRNEDEIMEVENDNAYLERSPPPNNEAEGHPDRPENDDHRNEDEIMEVENDNANLERSPPPSNNDSELQRQLQHEAQHIKPKPLDDMKRMDLADKSNSDDKLEQPNDETEHFEPIDGTENMDIDEELVNDEGHHLQQLSQSSASGVHESANAENEVPTVKNILAKDSIAEKAAATMDIDSEKITTEKGTATTAITAANCPAITTKRREQHPNLLPFYGFTFHEEKNLYRLAEVYSPMTMSLRRYLIYLKEKKERDSQLDSQISPTHILEGTWQIFNGLNGLNNVPGCNAYHCDLNPDNILVKFSKNEDNDNDPFSFAARLGSIKIADFDSVKEISEKNISCDRPENEMFTRECRPPEVMLGLPFCKTADVWSVGVITAQMAFNLPEVLFDVDNSHAHLRLIDEMIGLVERNDWNDMISLTYVKKNYQERYFSSYARNLIARFPKEKFDFTPGSVIRVPARPYSNPLSKGTLERQLNDYKSKYVNMPEAYAAAKVAEAVKKMLKVTPCRRASTEDLLKLLEEFCATDNH
ncbi:dual specificity protein kinase yak1 [Tyrophagus putrescentiae]|nr:dual specificity protein kinase yak1 [Tyrophagus putrescentiae]